jgi:hypothetical protein
MSRTFKDSSGETWDVFEVVRTAQTPGAVRQPLGEGWLSFQHGEQRVRVARGKYPSDWEDLTDQELEDLMGEGLKSTAVHDPFDLRRKDLSS